MILSVHRCSLCNEYREIVFKDYQQGIGQIKVCHICALVLGWFTDLSKYELELNLMINCPKCSNRFYQINPKFGTCTNCYVKLKDKPEIKEVQICL